MKRLYFYLIAATILWVAVAASSANAQRSFDDRIDIAGLLTDAARHFDTAQDVIILSDGQSVTHYADGRFATTVHRILWINSYLAIDDCGDVRVPFDYDHCSFTPLAVRTWRDGQWWPSDSTGVVETLPFELEHAYDYAGMREMMLLLSGTGVPCIIEVAYRIEDRTPFRSNWDGLWRFARPDPAVESWFEFRAPSGSDVNVTVSEGEITRESSGDQTSGMESKVWRMRHVPAQPDPHSADPADLPHLIWSTWDSWNELGAMIDSGFDSAVLAPDSPLRAVIDSLKEESRTDRETMDLIARFLKERVSRVEYPESFWWTNPRDPDRIYSTAYAHRFDMAILAAAMFRAAGFAPRPYFVCESPIPIENIVPSLVRFELVQLAVHSHYVLSYVPFDATVQKGRRYFAEYATWFPGEPGLGPGRPDIDFGHFEVTISLGFDKDQSRWTGDGLLETDGGLSPFDQVSGLDGRGIEYVRALASSLIEGATVDDYSPELLLGTQVSANFSLKLDSTTVDDFKRTVLSIGEPKDGIIDRLPGQAAELFRTEMRSTTYLPYMSSQRVECRIDTAGFQIVYRPEDVLIKNAAGSLSVTTTIVHGKLVVVRELRLEEEACPPSRWPALRELLLAEGQPQNGRVILKAVGDDKL